MRILVLGGDGYLGWPTALHLSACGHEVAVNDNFARRGYDEEMGVDSLVPIATLEERLAAWAEVGGQELKSVRNFKPAFKRGLWFGMANSALEVLTRGRTPWTSVDGGGVGA